MPANTKTMFDGRGGESSSSYIEITKTGKEGSVHIHECVART